MLFYVNGFCATYDPRLVDQDIPTEQPFVTYPFQDDVLLTLCEKIGREDVLLEKSRDMGASWMCLIAFNWFWKFKRRVKFFLMSHCQEMVDDPKDMDALFPKLAFIEKYMPWWLRPKSVRTFLLYHNLENESTITGASTTGRSGAGGRCTAALIDEFSLFQPSAGYQSLAAVQHMTNSRIFNSTYRGQVGAYYEVSRKMKQVKPQNVKTLHWSQHPKKAKGMYKPLPDGGFDILDKNGIPAEYKMRSDIPKGPWKVRSPYYDAECDRTPIPSQIAQELDIDPIGSGEVVFDAEVIERHISKYARSPVMTGHLDFDENTFQPKSFLATSTGRLKLWLPLPAANTLPYDRKYVVSCDISQGVGASESALTVVDRQSKEKVASYTDPHIAPLQFADLTCAIGYWFNEAELIWEMNGPGIAFGDRIRKNGYRRFYMRKDDVKIGGKQTTSPGWHTNDKTKRLLLSRYHHALARGTFLNRCEAATRQCLEYVYLGDKIEHVAVRDGRDDSEGRESHGDRVIADALANWMLDEKPLFREASKTQGLPELGPRYGTGAWLEEYETKRELAAANAADEW